jgi:nicotinamidase/pyrazinamidase
MNVTPQPGDALVIVDVQRDFVGGNLAVPNAEQVVPVLEHYIGCFRKKGLPIFATRDWHPADHVSFHERGGIWPAHCVAGTQGAEFAPGLSLASGATVVSKGTSRDIDAYSAFEGTGFDETLRRAGIRRLFVGGLATDYCVLATVRDALDKGYRVFLLADAIRAVDRKPGDGAFAVRTMLRLGAELLHEQEVDPRLQAHG